MSLVVVYRSDRPEVLDAWATYAAERTRFANGVKALTAEMWPELVDGHKPEPVVLDGGPFHPGARSLAGWSWRYRIPAPDGWKYDSSRGVLTPKVSTKLGKAAQKRMSDAAPNVRALGLPGMPSTDLDHLPAAHSHSAEHHGSFLYVGWAIEPKRVDTSIWEQIKLSEYYTVREAEQVAS